MAQVYLGMVTNKLGSTVFSAKEVGYTLSLKPNPRGVELELGGLSDDNIIQRLINTTIRSKGEGWGRLNGKKSGEFLEFWGEVKP